MNRRQARDRKLENLLHSAALLAGMALLLAVPGYLIFGASGFVLALVAGVTLVSLGSSISPQWVLRLYRAGPIGPYEAPRLLSTVRELARRAELPSVPRLYLIPSAQPNAFAVGSADDSAVAVTDGLLRRLRERQLAGVLAHEISHVMNHDLRIMSLAGVMNHMTRTLSFLGPMILVLTLPLAILGRAEVPWLTLFVLMVAPTLSSFLQLALSRTREFDADLDAARLTGDPLGLASALARLEMPASGWLWQLFAPYRRQEISPLLRSHPPTEERVRRLQALDVGPVHRADPRRQRTVARRIPSRPAARPAPVNIPVRLGPIGGRRIYPVSSGGRIVRI